MTWFLKLPDGTKLDLDSIDAYAYSAVEAETGQKWFEVSGNPYRHLSGALALMKQVLPAYGVEMPDPFPMGAITKWYEYVDGDTLPTSGTTAPVVEESESPTEADAV